MIDIDYSFLIVDVPYTETTTGICIIDAKTMLREILPLIKIEGCGDFSYFQITFSKTDYGKIKSFLSNNNIGYTLGSPNRNKFYVYIRSVKPTDADRLGGM